MEAFDCDAEEITNSSPEQTLEKISEDSVAMARADSLNHCNECDAMEELSIGTPTAEPHSVLVSSENSEFTNRSMNLPAMGADSMFCNSLPADCSKWTKEQRQYIFMQLVNYPPEPVKSNGNYRHDTSSDESVVTSPSMAGDPVGHVNTISRRHRTAYVWNGELPPRNYSHPLFSCKIFVGGVPWDITEDALMEAFSVYGACHVEWPGKEPRYSRSQMRDSPRGKATGYVYMIFEYETSVKALLKDCSQEFGSAGEWYFKLRARRNQTTEIRQVQIIPWVVSDASYVADPGCRLDAKKTVFVGALHGMITANVLYSIMEELYGNVVFVGIDTDKYKYPIGSGRVTFRSHSSYFRAIESAFLEIKTSKFGKKVQIDPFLEDAPCMMCNRVPGPYFCRDRACFRYFCHTCWQSRHTRGSGFDLHRPLMRNAPRIPTIIEEDYFSGPPRSLPFQSRNAYSPKYSHNRGNSNSQHFGSGHCLNGNQHALRFY
ncbi:unnamed protein product [Auanema sp. JU1783]|nr:unnamed protein product [Auanema sp. JU1783]